VRKITSSLTALVTALVLASGTAAAAPVRDGGAGGPAGRAAQDRYPGHTITLITGDRVRVGAGETPSITVRPAPGRERVPFQAFSAHGRQYLIPLDAKPLIDAGRLDRRLFDLTSLVEFGYTDDRRDTVPVIVTHREGAMAAVDGLTATTALSSVDGVAAVVRKAGAATTWRQLTTSPAVDKVWLDGLRKPSLDRSVPQIGAPAAHEAGFTGTGTRVAVLDTGVDASHPDLAGKVGAARNFTEEPDGDMVGHGTHVASTVAGTGAASGGRFRGVAYGATLLDGKVCMVFGCPESSILAGMEWAAAEQQADVVNMSLGGADGPDDDPLEQAVDRLTAEHGTLFVIAAGNSGGVGTVSSPSTADAALSVGAVDKQDVLAPFSSRGPRLDGAIKPEVTAPGVAITAARAGGVPDAYVAASGTSMATPHVAGAAALLAQRHPDWTPAQLKSALVGTARPAPGVDVFAQGGGRIDVGAAIGQALLAEPATLSLGRTLWPHDDDEPVRREATLRNTGPDDVTLALRLEVSGPDGSPAPQGVFTLDGTEVTVPAGGSATIGVTANTRLDAPDGHYGGRVVASADGVTLAIPVGVDKEVESYDVPVSLLGFDGAPTSGFITLFDLVNSRFYDVGVTGGSAVVRLPRGRYLVHTTVFDEDTRRLAILTQPLFELAGPAALNLDARQARPIQVTVPEPAVENALIAPGFTQTTPDGMLSSIMLTGGQVYLGHLGPQDVPGFVSMLGTQWARPDGSGWYDGTPELYATFAVERGRFFTGFQRQYRADDFARVRDEHRTQQPDRLAFRGIGARPAGVFAIRAGLGVIYPLPSTRTQFLAGDDARWGAGLEQGHPELGGERELGFDDRVFRAGRTYTERWNEPVFGPALPEHSDDALWISRTGDTLIAIVPMFGDGSGHYGFAFTGRRAAGDRRGVLRRRRHVAARSARRARLP
jgi:hypothetical protein